MPCGSSSSRTRPCCASTWSTCGTAATGCPASRFSSPRRWGALLSTLAYALLPSNEAGFSDEEVVGTLTELLLAGVRGESPEAGDPS
ncbi:exported hypothetical protein [Frankia sp. Hr75.2]|nr:exported hypothetical protein [Frankia sp. Hr75.2]